MRKWLRRIRGAIGMGLTWAAGWAPIGALIGTVMWLVIGGIPLSAVIARYLVTFGVLGFLGGGLFSTLLGIAESNRGFDQLTIPRFALWGGLGGLALGSLAAAGGLYGAGFSLAGSIVAGASTLLGAGSAVATLALARKADPPKVGGSGALPDVGLTEKEKRELLGSTR